jgi:hypothetical protein
MQTQTKIPPIFSSDRDHCSLDTHLGYTALDLKLDLGYTDLDLGYTALDLGYTDLDLGYTDLDLDDTNSRNVPHNPKSF